MKAELKEIYKQDAARVHYLRSRFIKGVMSPSEAQELTNLTHKYGQRNKAKTQERLDKIALSREKIKAQPQGSYHFLEWQNREFEAQQKQLEQDKPKIDASRPQLLSGIAEIRRKLRLNRSK